MYCFDTRIRYSEVDKAGRLTLPGLLNYFQDVCTFQAEDVGVGTLYLRENGLAWVLNAWQIDVVRQPVLCDRVEIATIPYEIRGILGYRNFYMKDIQTGEMLAVANSVWTMMDMKKLMPCRVSEKICKAYELSEKLEMEYMGRKLKFTGEGIRKGEIPVRAHHLDTNSHVNNGQYVQMAMDFIPQGANIIRMRAEYKKSAVLGDVITPVVYVNDRTTGVALTDGAEAVYANVEFCTG